MSSVQIEGGRPLEGDVRPSGSKDSAIKAIVFSLFSNEDVVLENIPHTSGVELIVDIARSIGATVEWVSDNKLTINGSTINSYEVDKELGSRSRFTLLFAGPLLYRFGKATLPLGLNTGDRPTPINRWIDTWEALGISVNVQEELVELIASELHGSNINFKISTHTGTVNALLSAAFIPEETQIINAAEETEVDDLIDFINTLGGEAQRIEPRRIKIVGKNVYSGGFFEIQPDNNETVAYATAALLTKGNITIKGIKKLQLTSFVNFLTKVGARYEYNRDELNVWYGGEEFQPVKVESSPAPGFLADWLSYAVVLATAIEGTSYMHNTIYVDRFGFVQDLNRMGAHILIRKPSEVGIQCVISDESYDYNKYGEPCTVAEISGPTRLRGTKLNMDDPRFDSTLIIAALAAEGKSTLVGVDEMVIRYERFFDKLTSLGAIINHID